MGIFILGIRLVFQFYHSSLFNSEKEIVFVNSMCIVNAGVHFCVMINNFVVLQPSLVMYD